MRQLNRWLILFLLVCTEPFKPAQADGSSVATATNARIFNDGYCNVTVINSGGSKFDMTCTPSTAQSFPDKAVFELILGYTQLYPAVAGNINWNFVDQANSYITIYVDKHQVIYEDLTTPFNDEDMKLSKGIHKLKFELNISYHPFAGLQAPPADATCIAILDLQAPGKIYPQFVVQQAPDGSIYPVKCGFNVI